MLAQFSWICKRDFLGNIKSVEIFQEGIKYGEIPNISLNEFATINGNSFWIKPKKWYLGGIGNENYIINPVTNVVWGVILVDFNLRKVILKLNEKVEYDISISTDDPPAFTNNLAVQIYKDQLFFTKSGRIEIRSDTNIELLLVSAFYACYIRDNFYD